MTNDYWIQVILTLKMCLFCFGVFLLLLLVVATVAGLPPALTSTKLKNKKWVIILNVVKW